MEISNTETVDDLDDVVDDVTDADGADADGNTGPDLDAAIEMRLAGHTYRAIAEATGFSGPGQVYKAISKALREQPTEDAEELLAKELATLDAMQAKLWPGVVAGNISSVDAVSRIMDRRAKLTGLDRQTIVVETPENVTPIDDLRRRHSERARGWAGGNVADATGNE